MRFILLILISSSLTVQNSPAIAGYEEASRAYFAGEYQTALAELNAIGDAKNAAAYWLLGMMHLNGDGVDANASQAIKYFEKSVEGGDTSSMNTLAVLYRDGLPSLPTNHRRALELFSMAAEAGDEAAHANLGISYYLGNPPVKGKDYEKALHHLSLAATVIPAATYYLGVMAYRGQGMATSIADGTELIKIAANAGHVSAQRDLGRMYEFGSPPLQLDLGQAAQWTKSAADQGDAEAQWRYGMHLVRGQAVPQNSSEAILWFKRAAQQKFPNALVSLGVMSATGDGIEQDLGQAFSFYQEAVKMGVGEAAKNIAAMYYNGEYVQQDHFLAATWFGISAELGSEAGADYFAGIIEDLEAHQLPLLRQEIENQISELGLRSE